MNIKIIKENLHSLTDQMGYSVNMCEVHVDDTLDERTQSEIVIHEILEAYLPSLSHERIDDLTELIVEGLDQLEEK